MRDDDEDRDPRPYDTGLAEMLHGALKAKARATAVLMALAVGTFVWAARDAGQPLWLVLLIGFLGAILILFLIALVWFWLRFLSHFRGRSRPDAEG